MKKLFSLALCFIIMVSMFTVNSFAAENSGSLDNFKAINSYVSGQFSDVPKGAWCEDSVATAFELGLMSGNGSTFNPSGNITIAQTIVLACRLHSIYFNDGTTFTKGHPWYQNYVDYALNNGIISSAYSDYSKAATRAEFAVILYGALPSEALSQINTVDDNIIPDVPSDSKYLNAVYALYRSGVTIGNDSFGTFTPNSNITRSAVAVIITRMANLNLRKSVTLTQETRWSGTWTAHSVQEDGSSFKEFPGASDVDWTIDYEAKTVMSEYGAIYNFTIKDDNTIIVTFKSGTETLTMKSNNTLWGINDYYSDFSNTDNTDYQIWEKPSTDLRVVKSVEINPWKISVSKGNEYQLTGCIYPSSVKDKTLVWSSSNSKIATVSDSGLVTAVSIGTATIYAKALNGMTASCPITVLDPKVADLQLAKLSYSKLKSILKNPNSLIINNIRAGNGTFYNKNSLDPITAHIVVIDYSAMNGFGGYNRENFIGYYTDSGSLIFNSDNLLANLTGYYAINISDVTG